MNVANLIFKKKKKMDVANLLLAIVFPSKKNTRMFSKSILVIGNGAVLLGLQIFG